MSLCNSTSRIKAEVADATPGPSKKSREPPFSMTQWKTLGGWGGDVQRGCWSILGESEASALERSTGAASLSSVSLMKCFFRN